jgi:hypothetical protein
MTSGRGDSQEGLLGRSCGRSGAANCTPGPEQETVMEQDETPLERAQRHVMEGEAQMWVQVTQLGELIYLRKDTTRAKAVIADLDGTLRFLREKLELELAEAARHRWP